MKRLERGWGMVFLLFFITFFVAACGGDGGGGGVESVTYTGNAAPAVITNTSAEAIALEAYKGGETGGSIPDLMGAGPMGGGSLSVTAALPGPVGKAVDRALSGVPRFTQSGSMPGTCGGSADYNVTFNETTGDFSFIFNFKSYCETDGLVQTVINGAVSFAGKLHLGLEEYPEHMTAVFGNLTSVSSDGSENVTLGGSLSMTMSGPDSGTMTMNFVVRDNATGKTYWVDDYVATIADYGSYEEIDVSGRFCHHDYGCVELSTPTPMQSYPDEHPYAGVLQLDGAGGASIRLTFLDATSYQVTVESGDDALYDEYDSGTLNWYY